MISFKSKGDLKKTYKFLGDNLNPNYMTILERYAQVGVDALSSATPVDSGETSRSWGYEIKKTKNSCQITWYNTNVVNGVPVAILLQYGHGTKNGGWVQGRDYINPVLKPIFDRIAEDAWREVTR